jgi:predicted site-specific integrase-resolvase
MASQVLGVSISTLRRWDYEQKLTSVSCTTGGHRRYDLRELQIFCNDKNIKNDDRKVVAYCRVSSHDQKLDMILAT